MPIAVSAPGKVLLAGGYLVLDRRHTGLVFGLSARIHVLLSVQGSIENQITVCSPQFTDATWVYNFSAGNGGKGVVVSQSQDSAHGTSPPNHFIETTLTYALTYITASNPKIVKTPSIKITILADADYYSHEPQPSKDYPRFPSFNVPLLGAHKTGLGSSAALVSALTSALLLHFIPTFDLDVVECRTRLHNLAQAAHCASQGKIGSGFDVAAAIYGTCIYRRFTPSILESIGDPGTAGFAARVQVVTEDLEKNWDVEIVKPCGLMPSKWALVLCDVDCGSATVSMVKKVLKWREDNPQIANSIWDELDQLQAILVAQLKAADVHGVRQSLARIREQARIMGTSSGAAIEPYEQTTLIDAINFNVGGVIGGIVPGAGGYDAIVVLIRDHVTVVAELKLFLEAWRARWGGNFRALGVKGDSEGVVMENYEDYTRRIYS